MSDALRSSLPSRGRAIFYVIVIFVAGAVFGSALTFGVGRHMLQRARANPAWNADTLRRLDRQLELTPEQRERVQPILADMTGRLRDNRVAARRESIAIVQETRDKLRAELTAEQQAEFDRLATRLRENLGRMLGGAADRPWRERRDDAAPPAQP